MFWHKFAGKHSWESPVIVTLQDLNQYLNYNTALPNVFFCETAF